MHFVQFESIFFSHTNLHTYLNSTTYFSKLKWTRRNITLNCVHIFDGGFGVRNYALGVPILRWLTNVDKQTTTRESERAVDDDLEENEE